MSTHIDALHTTTTGTTVTTDTELGERYPGLEDIRDERVLALEAPGNCHLVVVEGDLEQFARDVWAAVFGSHSDPAEPVWYTCVDCDSGDMVEDAARWHAGHEGHTVEPLDQGEPRCDECDEPATQFWSQLDPPVQMCDSCVHDARRSGWEPAQSIVTDHSKG